jgi:hypothetical protein
VSVEDSFAVDELTEKVVGQCATDGFVVSFWGEGGAEDVEDEVLGLLGGLVEADAAWPRQREGWWGA